MFYLMDVIAQILCYLKRRILKVLKDFGCEVNSSDIDWVITVPAIWRARGKKMMREAGYKVSRLCVSRFNLVFLFKIVLLNKT